MQSRDLLLTAYDNVEESVRGALEEIDPALLTVRVDPDANTIAWLVWHLTRVQDDHVAEVAGTEQAYTENGWAARFGLPPDRIGDVVVVSERLYVIGTSPSRHDLSGLDAPLRSHGGLSEQTVPLLFNRRLEGVAPDRRWRNFDIFDLSLNHAA